MSEHIEPSGMYVHSERYPVPAPAEQQQVYEHGIDRLDDTINKIMHKPMTRRSLFALVGGLAAGYAVNGIEKGVMDSHWPDQPSRIVLPPNMDSYIRPARGIGLSSSGYDGTHGPVIVSDLQEHVYGKHFANAYIEFGSTFDIAGLQKQAINYRNALRPKKVDIHGVSSGLHIGLYTMQAAEVPARMIDANSSQFDTDDIAYKAVLNTIAQFRKLGMYHGGLIGETASFFMQQLKNYGVKRLGDNLHNAMYTTWHGIKPRANDDLILFLSGVNLRHDWHMFRRLITPDTYFLFFAGRNDPVIDDAAAADKYHEWLQKRFHVDDEHFRTIYTPMEGHAHITTAIKAGAATMQAITNGTPLPARKAA